MQRRSPMDRQQKQYRELRLLSTGGPHALSGFPYKIGSIARRKNFLEELRRSTMREGCVRDGMSPRRRGEGTMYKNIIVFSDGTGNSSGKLFKTNVWRVYQAVDLTDPQVPAEPRQFAFYDNGVGTSSFKPFAALGGALGVGLARNVRDLYAFVCRTYQPGDKIYAFGFS